MPIAYKKKQPMVKRNVKTQMYKNKEMSKKK